MCPSALQCISHSLLPDVMMQPVGLKQHMYLKELPPLHLRTAIHLMLLTAMVRLDHIALQHQSMLSRFTIDSPVGYESFSNCYFLASLLYHMYTCWSVLNSEHMHSRNSKHTLHFSSMVQGKEGILAVATEKGAVAIVK